MADTEHRSKKDKKEKKEKKDKKRKSSELDGAEEAVTTPAKKEKKEKKRKSTSTAEVDVAPGAVEVDEDGDVVVEDVKAEEGSEGKKSAVKVEIPLAALVPFANPLCDEKAQKKVLKSVKKGKNHADTHPIHMHTSPTTPKLPHHARLS